MDIMGCLTGRRHQVRIMVIAGLRSLHRATEHSRWPAKREKCSGASVGVSRSRLTMARGGIYYPTVSRGRAGRGKRLFGSDVAGVKPVGA